LPAGWSGDFRALVAVEPSLHGEYLKAFAAAEIALANAIADRTGTEPGRSPLVTLRRTAREQPPLALVASPASRPDLNSPVSMLARRLQALLDQAW
jgi:hypothetical protein